MEINYFIFKDLFDMKIMMTMNWPGTSLQQYDAIKKEVNWEGNVPKGAVLLLASGNNEVFYATDIWESEQDLNEFM